jgi:hypothetical protein
MEKKELDAEWLYHNCTVPTAAHDLLHDRPPDVQNTLSQTSWIQNHPAKSQPREADKIE